MEIKQLLIPASNTKTRPGIKMIPRFITIHETDNTAAGADAEAHARLQYSGNDREASWHYTVDDHEIWQSIPDNEVAWHAGDGHGTGNMESLAIEICVNADGDFERAKANAIWLIHYLMDKHGIPIDRVVPHQHWSGKNCPRHILTYWDAFIQQIQGAAGTSSYDKQAAYHRLLSLESPMLQGEDVKAVQKRLGVNADGIYGPKTKEAVMKFQQANGLNVDGIVGPQTWNALFPPMYRVQVEGKVVVDTAYRSKILDAVDKAVSAQKNRIEIFLRDE